MKGMNFKMKLLLGFGILLLLGGCRYDVSVKKTVKINKEDSKPNVLLIYVDQLRRYSAGFWSEPFYRSEVVGKPDPVVTPNMDSLAHRGVVLTQAFANYPLCSPSRGMMLTGLYPEQNGLWNNARKDREIALDPERKTITDVFAEAGYDIGYFGKAHFIKPEPFFNEQGDYVGTADSTGGHYINNYDTYVPPGKDRHQIDYFFQNVKDQHYDPLTYSNDPDLVGGKSDGEVFRPKEFTTKIEAEALLKYVYNRDRERDKEKPFFAIWSINPPHSPWDEKNTDMDELRKHYHTDKYPVVDSLLVRDNVKIPVAEDYVRNYFANTTAIDNYIGQVLDSLDRLGLLENTIVVLTADHGEMMGSQGLQNKNVLYTEAMAVPFIVSWPKGLDSGKTEVLLSSPDILPTLANMAKIEPHLPKAVEGTNLAPYILGEIDEEDAPDHILLLLGNSRGIQTHQYTLVLKENKEPWDEFESHELEEAYLFDNQEDPYQLHKIPLEERPEATSDLLKKLAKKLADSNDPWYQQKKYADLIPYEK